MPWFHERSSNKFFYLTWWWTVTDVWELSRPFTKISLLCFTRSKGLGNETLKELWQRERWMSRKWKGLVACSSTDSGGAVWEGALIVLASPLPGRGMNSSLQHLTQETQPELMGWVQSMSHCHLSMYPLLLLLLAVLGIHSLSALHFYLHEKTVICMYNMKVVPPLYILYWKYKLYSILLYTFKRYIIAPWNILFVWLFQLFTYLSQSQLNYGRCKGHML